MYAIIRAGGKQAKVHVGDVLEIERVKDPGTSVSFTPILVVDEGGTAVSGSGKLAGAKVIADVLGETKGDKIDIFKYKNKTGYRRHQGHRQTYTQIRVTGIELPKAKPARSRQSKQSKED
ncbi:MAG: 50S ribosomal protein L21 [Actinomycetota bacterium]